MRSSLRHCRNKTRGVYDVSSSLSLHLSPWLRPQWTVGHIKQAARPCGAGNHSPSGSLWARGPSAPPCLYAPWGRPSLLHAGTTTTDIYGAPQPLLHRHTYRNTHTETCAALHVRGHHLTDVPCHHTGHTSGRGVGVGDGGILVHTHSLLRLLHRCGITYTQSSSGLSAGNQTA